MANRLTRMGTRVILLLFLAAFILVIPVVAQSTADRFGVNEVVGDPNTDVNVPVIIENAQNGPIISLIFDLGYDTTIASVKTVQQADLTAAWDTPSFNNFAWGTRVSIVYDGDEAHALQNGVTGPVVIVTFSIADQPGTTSELTVSNIQFSDTNYEVGTAPSKSAKISVTGEPRPSLRGATATPSLAPGTSPGTSGLTPTSESPGLSEPLISGFEAPFAILSLLVLVYVVLGRARRKN